MPALTTALDEEVKLRLLFYGAAKTRKTWLAGTAAEAGFNVIYLDNEHGFKIFSQLSPEAQQRIYRIDISDTLKRAVSAEFMTYLCKFDKFFWDEAAKKRVMRVANESDPVIQLDHSRFDSSTVLVLDSYTELVWSLTKRYAIEQGIDLSEAEKADWDAYRFTGTLSTWILEQLTKFNCHIVVIGHATNYEKRSKDGKTIEWIRTQPKSTSGPHGMTIANKFDDVLFFHMKGSQVYIDARPDRFRDSGGRVIPPKEYKWDELQFAELCKLAGVKLPDPDSLPPVSQLVAVDNSVTANETPAATATVSKTKAATRINGLIKR